MKDATKTDWTTADLFDNNAGEVRTCPLQLRDFGNRIRFHGPVRTIECLDDNVLLRHLLEEPGSGAVAIVDGHGSTAVALMGDRIAAMAARNGWSGVVLNAAVRDAHRLAGIDLGIRALGTNPAKSQKAGNGKTHVAIELAGTIIRPDDWVYADEDGLLFSRRQLA